ALAVLLSYLVQTRLAARFKYRSIYEAQVPARADSPAHHTKYVEIALRILREQEPSNLDDIGELDLVTLVRSGIPVELSNGRRFFIGVLRADSRFVGTTIGTRGRELAGRDTNIL